MAALKFLLELRFSPKQQIAFILFVISKQKRYEPSKNKKRYKFPWIPNKKMSNGLF